MNPHDLPPGFDDPVEALLGFHRRIERALAALGKLPCDLEVNGMDAQSTAAAASIIDFFSSALAIHHADEDELLPMLELRTAQSPQRDAIRELRHRLEVEHREMDRTWRTLRRPLESIAEGMHRVLPQDLVQYFRASHATHISLEEAGLHATAARCLLPADRATLGRGMVARRTRRYRFHDK
jgi:hemerythrin-like domain-containing protein